MLLLGLQFLVSVGAGGLILTIIMDGNVIERTLEARAAALHAAQQQRELIMFQVRAARSFSQFADMHHYHAYWHNHHSGAHDAILHRFVELGVTQAEHMKLWESEVASEEMLVIEKVSMVLTIEAFGHDLSQYPEVCRRCAVHTEGTGERELHVESVSRG